MTFIKTILNNVIRNKPSTYIFIIVLLTYMRENNLIHTEYPSTRICKFIAHLHTHLHTQLQSISYKKTIRQNDTLIILLIQSYFN